MAEVTGATKKVLVVEDEKVMQILVNRLFKRGEFGVETLTVGTIKEGIDAIEKNDLVLLVTDMSLPDGRGVDVIRRFRAKFPDGPIIVMSGSLTIEAEVEAIDGAKVRKILPKPFTVDDFHAAVSGALKS